MIKSSVDHVEGRYGRYHDDLFDYVAQIVMLEREHEKRATQIQKKVSDKVDALATLLDKNGPEA
ncbi:MAG TPA: hypothetical protein PKD80_05150 [Microthrixaceae bacterium]|nr:hypothetical protein [Microthrixaceae bacterium]HMT24434.1 hypothetical protein [Microthrixaceae bacterium]HMT60865.1 hypothetical protein [Microthrixaceae bacterium]